MHSSEHEILNKMSNDESFKMFLNRSYYTLPPAANEKNIEQENSNILNAE